LGTDLQSHSADKAEVAVSTLNAQRSTLNVMHRSLGRRLAAVVAGLLLLLLASVVVAAGLGAVHIPPGELLRMVVQRARGLVVGEMSSNEQILWNIRLPRIALGAVVGGSLSIAGGALQGLLLNPLADPYLIGVSAGAAFGATLAILTGFADFAGGLGRLIAGFLAALLALAIVYFLSLRRGRIGRESFILAGVVVGSFMWALVTFVVSVANDAQHKVLSWLMGDLAMSAQWPAIGLVAGFALLASLILYLYGRDLNLLALGEESAKQLGVDVERLKKIVILFSALLTTTAVAFAGVIGFVGLIIPHIARRLWGPDHRILLPASALLGAAFLIWADTIARTVSTSELPVGVITSLLGAPFFCYLLVSSFRRGGEES
jgi:iron complex transport system permease protein